MCVDEAGMVVVISSQEYSVIFNLKFSYGFRFECKKVCPYLEVVSRSRHHSVGRSDAKIFDGLLEVGKRDQVAPHRRRGLLCGIVQLARTTLDT